MAGKHYSEEGSKGKLLRGGSILVGAGSAEYRAQVWGRGLSRQGDVSWAQSLAPIQGAAPSRPSRLASWVGFRGTSPVSFFGGTALITFERQPTSCPFPSDPGPRGNAFLLFSVAKDSGFPAPTSKGLCTLSRVSCSIPCLPSGNLPPDAPLGVPSPSALSPCRGNGVLSITVWVGDEHELQAGQTWGLLMVGWGQSISSGLIN